MALRETGFGIFTSAMLAIVALPLVACGESTRTDGARGNGSGGTSGSSGSTGGSRGGSNGVGGATGDGGATGGSGATAGSGADGGMGGDGGNGDAGGAEERASFRWIEPTEEHRERAATATTPALLRTVVVAPFGAAAVIGTSTVFTGQNLEQIATEAIAWTEEMGTTGLGGLPGEDDAGTGVLSEPLAISADGSVVVGYARSSLSELTPFRWTRADGMEAIAGVPGLAIAVSADGSVVVGDEGEPQRAFRWTGALGAVTLEPLAGDDTSGALAMSADGATVLGRSYRGGGGAGRLFVWTESSGARAIDNLPGYAECAAALPNDGLSGFALGGDCRDEAGRRELFVWAGQDQLVTLGSPDALSGYELESPVAVAADGTVAVGSAVRAGMDGIEMRTYRWTEAGGVDLIELPEGFTSTAHVERRSTMSEDGSVLVGRMTGAADRSFLWSEDAGAVVLLPLDGHDISNVYVVSADGSVAGGSSYRLGPTNDVVDSTAVYWRADGVPHRIADELLAEGVDLGGGTLREVRAVQAPHEFIGSGSKDRVNSQLSWRARLP